MRKFVLALALVGCGGSESLEGSWLFQPPDRNSALQVQVDGDAYSFQQLTLNVEGGILSEAERGTVRIDGDRATFTPAEASCDVARPWTAVFDGSLVLGDRILQRIAPERAWTDVQYGCMSRDGTWTPGVLRPVP